VSFQRRATFSPILLYPSAKYYSDAFTTENYEFALPDTIDEYLDRVFALSSEAATQFAIASTWFSHIPSLWMESSSSAFIAAVSAIEALLKKESETCRECGQPKFSLTRKFKAFIEAHVPNIKMRFPEELNLIYKVRSDLAHGGKLLLSHSNTGTFSVGG
jgi:hypothetical protein